MLGARAHLLREKATSNVTNLVVKRFRWPKNLSGGLCKIDDVCNHRPQTLFEKPKKKGCLWTTGPATGNVCHYWPERPVWIGFVQKSNSHKSVTKVWPLQGSRPNIFWSLLVESVLISYSMFIPGCSSGLFCSRSSSDLKERSQQYWRGILKIVSKRGRPTSCHKWVTPVAWNLAWLDCTGCTICWTIFDYMPPIYRLTVGCPAFWHGPADKARRTRWSRNFAGMSSWATGWMWQVLRTGRQNWCRNSQPFAPTREQDNLQGIRVFFLFHLCPSRAACGPVGSTSRHYALFWRFPRNVR